MTGVTAGICPTDCFPDLHPSLYDFRCCQTDWLCWQVIVRTRGLQSLPGDLFQEVYSGVWMPRSLLGVVRLLWCDYVFDCFRLFSTVFDCFSSDFGLF